MSAPAAPAPLATRPALVSAAAAGVCAVWAATVWTAVHLRADPLLHDVALFVHLASLLVGFGAVLTVDWLGLMWLSGRRSLPEVLRTAGAVHLPVWLGLAGLTVTGALLHPDAGAPLTRVKLGLVLLVALNGLHAHALQPRLAAVAAGRAPASRRLTVRCAAAVLLSQLGWWGATVIGFLNSRH